MSDFDTIAWFDGELLPVREVRVSALSHSLHYGTGVFEGIRCYRQEQGGGGVFRLRDHVERFLRSASVLGYAIPWSCDALVEATLQTLRENEMDEAYIRPLAWLGEGRMGVAGGDNPIHTLIAVWRWGAYLGEEGLKQGVRVAITGHERPAGNAFAQQAKVTGQYVTSFMAKRQARALGLDEGLLLDRDGFVVEATGENLFLVRRGTLVTPSSESPILDGITRASVITLAADLQIPVELSRFTRTDLYAADEIFMTGTAAEVTPIREIDGRPVKSSPGPITKKLQDAYLGVVRGRGARAAEWVTPLR